MNTDEILDFVVDYWFVIVGGILLLAIIGFIAEKKKILPKTKKSKKTVDVKSEESQIRIEENNLDSNMVIDSQDIDKLNQGIQNYSVQNLPNEDLEIPGQEKNDESINSTNNKNDSETSNLEVNNNIVEVKNEENNLDNSNFDKNVMTTDASIENLYNGNYNVKNNELQPDFSSDKGYNRNENLEFSEDKSYNFFENGDKKEINEPLEINDETLSAIVNDINKIDSMNFFSKNEDKMLSEEKNSIMDDITLVDDKTKEIVENIPDKTDESITKEVVPNKIDSSKIAEAAANDDLEDTMQISYSQLKQMVEGIIAENQKDNSLNDVKEQETNKSQSIQNSSLEQDSSVIDIPLPNLDNITVDSINEQDDDEDDVWKF